jgi:hypothetical protein
MPVMQVIDLIAGILGIPHQSLGNLDHHYNGKIRIRSQQPHPEFRDARCQEDFLEV